VRYVIEELLSCLDLARCHRLRISYGDTPAGRVDTASDTPLVHIPAHVPFDGIGAADFNVIMYAGAPVPIVGRSAEVAIIRHATPEITFDLIATAFYFLAGRDMSGRTDKLGRARCAGSILASLRSTVPPVNALVSMLAEAIQVAGGDVAPRIRPIMCVTGEAALSDRPAHRDWEREMGIVRTTFAPPRRRDRADTGTQADEIGLEATSDSFSDKEIEEVAAITGMRPRGVRMRDLRFEIDRMARSIEGADLAYDSSVAYPDAAEFATGFTYPHRLFSARLGRPLNFVEVPLYLPGEMLRRDMRASSEELKAAIEHGGNVVGQVGGALTVSLRADLGADRDAGGYRDSLRSAIGNLIVGGMTSVSLSAAVDSRRDAYAGVRVEVLA
jgi:hypothetical protein